MPLIWCAISSHGFGHAAQVLPVLNELGRKVPGLMTILRTRVPRWFFEGRLSVAWEWSPSEQDIGCVQRGPLKIEIGETWAAYQRLHADWAVRVREEEQAIRVKKPDLVLSDISYLAVEAGARAQVSTVGLCNLSWDRVLKSYAEPGRTDQLEIIHHIERAYSCADLMIRPSPGVPMPAFRHLVDVGPIAQHHPSDKGRLREATGASPDEPIVLIGFGGVELDSLPYDRLEQLVPYRFVVSGSVPDQYKRLRSMSSLPLPFRSLIASVDVLVTKPGYSTIVEAVALAQPVVFVRRYDFVDEEALVNYVTRYGRAIELPEADFRSGQWKAALDAAQTMPHPAETAPPATGAAEAASVLARYL